MEKRNKMPQKLIDDEAGKDYRQMDSELISLLLDMENDSELSLDEVKDETRKIMSKAAPAVKKKKSFSLTRILVAAAVIAVSIFICTAAVTASYGENDENLFAYVQRKLDKQSGAKSDTADERADRKHYRETFTYYHTLSYNIRRIGEMGFSGLLLPEIVQRKDMLSTENIFYEEDFCTKVEFWQYDKKNYVTVRIRDYGENTDKMPDIEKLRGQKAQCISSDNLNVFVWTEPSGRIMLEYISGNNYYKISADCSLDEMLTQAKILCRNPVKVQ